GSPPVDTRPMHARASSAHSTFSRTTPIGRRNGSRGDSTGAPPRRATRLCRRACAVLFTRAAAAVHRERLPAAAAIKIDEAVEAADQSNGDALVELAKCHDMAQRRQHRAAISTSMP